MKEKQEVTLKRITKGGGKHLVLHIHKAHNLGKVFELKIKKVDKSVYCTWTITRTILIIFMETGLYRISISLTSQLCFRSCLILVKQHSVFLKFLLTLVQYYVASLSFRDLEWKHDVREGEVCCSKRG